MKEDSRGCANCSNCGNRIDTFSPTRGRQSSDGVEFDDDLPVKSNSSSDFKWVLGGAIALVIFMAMVVICCGGFMLLNPK